MRDVVMLVECVEHGTVVDFEGEVCDCIDRKAVRQPRLPPHAFAFIPAIPPTSTCGAKTQRIGHDAAASLASETAPRRGTTVVSCDWSPQVVGHGPCNAAARHVRRRADVPSLRAAGSPALGRVGRAGGTLMTPPLRGTSSGRWEAP